MESKETIIAYSYSDWKNNQARICSFVDIV